MRRFLLIRDEDVSGVSGTGAVAEGVLFATGKVVLSWCSEYRSVTVYDTVGDLEMVHGHGGRTRIAWLDPLDAGDGTGVSTGHGGPRRAASRTGEDRPGGPYRPPVRPGRRASRR